LNLALKNHQLFSVIFQKFLTFFSMIIGAKRGKLPGLGDAKTAV
jgi:hypothetical protein